ncbi:MAG: hypothetical protein ACRDHY_18705, partial [Anaerolineales bacterium]
MMRGRGRAGTTFREAVEQGLEQWVDALKILERDLAALERQYADIPLRHEGAEQVLDAAQRECERGWAKIFGRAFEPAESLAASDVREVLAILGRLAQASGAALDVSPLAVKAEVWTGNGD